MPTNLTFSGARNQLNKGTKFEPLRNYKKVSIGLVKKGLIKNECATLASSLRNFSQKFSYNGPDYPDQESLLNETDMLCSKVNNGEQLTDEDYQFLLETIEYKKTLSKYNQGQQQPIGGRRARKTRRGRKGKRHTRKH